MQFFTKQESPVIILASFGTAQREGLTALYQLKKRFEQAFPENEIIQVFTSEVIRKKLMADRIYMKSLSEALNLLHDKNYKKVLIIPIYMCEGKEYDQKIVYVSGCYSHCFQQIFVGKPAFYFDSQRNVVDKAFFIRLLQALLPPDYCSEEMQVIFIGHGVRNEENLLYQQLQQILEKINPSFMMGLLESSGGLGLEETLKRLRHLQKRHVYLIPFLLFAGAHVLRDIAGNKAYSWRVQLLRAGYEVKVSCHGLMEFQIMQETYIRRARSYMQKMKR